MNSKKILNRLIQLFLLINIVLLLINIAKTVSRYTLSNQRINNITAILKDKGVQLNCELPRQFMPSAKLILETEEDTLANKEKVVKLLFGETMAGVKVSTTKNQDDDSELRTYTKAAESVSFEDSLIVYNNGEVNTSLKTDNILEAKSKCREFIKRIGKENKFKKMDIQVRQEGKKLVLEYYPCIKGLPILDIYMRFEVYKEGIRKAEMKFGEITYNNESKKTIYPIDVVLFGVEEYLPEGKNVNITGITLGYHSINASENMLWGEELIPVYKIEAEGLGSPLFVNAYTNKVLE